VNSKHSRISKKNTVYSIGETKMKQTLSILAMLAGASTAMAQFTPVTSVTVLEEWTGSGTGTNYWLQSITAGANTYLTNGLVTGTSEGWALNANIDDWNLSTLASGNPPLPVRTINFGGGLWTDSNGVGLDFFLFEASANVGTTGPDDISIAAVFADDSLGQSITAPTIVSPTGWGNTGFLMTIQQTGQALTGLAWSITDLKDALGNNLTTSSVIKGIAITAGNGIDPTGFFAVTPVPEPSTVALAILGLGGLVLFRKRS
jgi:hypothetical protein